MARTHFLPQAQLEEWALAEKADMKDGQLVIPGEPKPFPLTPAVHFTKLVTGTDDRKLVNKVKTQEQLSELGGEHMHDSVLLGETAYEVVTGYVLDEHPAGRASAQKPLTSETNLLADFLLKKMS